MAEGGWHVLDRLEFPAEGDTDADEPPNGIGESLNNTKSLQTRTKIFKRFTDQPEGHHSPDFHGRNQQGSDTTPTIFGSCFYLSFADILNMKQNTQLRKNIEQTWQFPTRSSAYMYQIKLVTSSKNDWNQASKVFTWISHINDFKSEHFVTRVIKITLSLNQVTVSLLSLLTMGSNAGLLVTGLVK